MTIEQIKNLPIYWTNEGLGYKETIGVLKLPNGKYFVIEEELNYSESQLYEIGEDYSESGFTQHGVFGDSDIFDKFLPIFQLITNDKDF